MTTQDMKGLFLVPGGKMEGETESKLFVSISYSSLLFFYFILQVAVDVG
jgi:hypothetical protein